MIRKLREFELSKFAPLLVTLSFIFILIQYSFHPLESVFLDFWTKSDFISTKIESPIALVYLDEESDQFLGDSYPYTYATHSRFLKRLIQDEPAQIIYFVHLQDPTIKQEESHQQQVHDLIRGFDPDKKRFRFGTELDVFGETLPPENLKDLGYSFSQLYKDQLIFARDEVVRRAILNVSGDDSLHLTSAKLLREEMGLEVLDAASYPGSYYSTEAEANFALFKYGPNPIEENLPSVPFHRVAVGNFPKNFFKDKIVLVGPKYLTNPSDFVFTPFNKEALKTPKLAVHAQIIDSLAFIKTITDVPELVSQILALLISIFLSLIISKVQPVKGLMVTISLIVGILVLSYSFYSLWGIWFKLSHTVLSIFVVYYIWVPFRAIEEYQTRYAIQEESKLLKKVDHLKQNFISLMSHDLKTPVAKIAGIADILKMKVSDKSEQGELVDNIMEATKELNSFINSILDLTKIESQNLTLKKESKDINKIIESTIDKLSFEASAKKIEIESELSPLYPIEIDVVLMNRVISNLVENALKYSGENKKVWVRSWDDSQWVYIEIKDNGPGIDPEELNHIFDKFYRVKNDSTHVIKGSGLGLYLVKYFIELHNGVITATSELGEGTSFIIKLKNE
ncbi:MAG TPA: ATP-binding protein [Bacteriovoracaceae bacterium]|nr:ATP-binding protein [Bacteriovoracaceae bacterium]